jgi:hypothetical protein
MRFGLSAKECPLVDPHDFKERSLLVWLQLEFLELARLRIPLDPCNDEMSLVLDVKLLAHDVKLLPL